MKVTAIGVRNERDTLLPSGSPRCTREGYTVMRYASGQRHLRYVIFTVDETR
jgi:hypothetical protein